jgi:hypothetical protein
MNPAEADRLFDELVALVDATPAAEHERMLMRLIIGLAEALGDYEKVREVIREAKEK